MTDIAEDRQLELAHMLAALVVNRKTRQNVFTVLDDDPFARRGHVVDHSLLLGNQRDPVAKFRLVVRSDH